MLRLRKAAVLGIPNPVLIWIAVCLAVAFLLYRTPIGRYIYAIGNSETAVYLSGIRTQLVLVAGFALCSMLAALAGILIAGYSSKAFQACSTGIAGTRLYDHRSADSDHPPEFSPSRRRSRRCPYGRVDRLCGRYHGRARRA
jgi:hypothetical protein